MNVLFVIHTPKNPKTAVYTCFRTRADFIDSQGHTTHITAPEDYRFLKSLSSRWYPLIFPVFLAFELLFKRISYDLIVFHSYSGWLINAMRRRLPGLGAAKTITEFHGLEPLSYAFLRGYESLTVRYRVIQNLMMYLLRISCRRSDRVFCLNSQESSYLIQQRWADERHVRRFANGASAELFAHRQYPDNARNLLFVGQWLHRKGIRYIVEAFQTLAREFPDIQLTCVGTLVPAATVLESFPAEVRQRVIVKPEANRQEIFSFYRKADIFVFPTLFEGFSLALLEAMAAGLPIVTTPVAAALDTLQDGVDVLFVPIQDSHALEEAIARLLRDKAERQRLGESARSAAQKYAWPTVCQSYYQLLLDTLVQQQPRNGRAET